MTPYSIAGSGAEGAGAVGLCERLKQWHDSMVAHERRLRAGRTADACDDECPHAEARDLWAEAQATFGPRASELTFLQSRATVRPPSAANASPRLAMQTARQDGRESAP